MKPTKICTYYNLPTNNTYYNRIQHFLIRDKNINYYLLRKIYVGCKNM